MKENVNHLELFRQLPYLDIDHNAKPVEGFKFGFEAVDDWGYYVPNLYHFDEWWHVCWIHCSEGDGIIDIQAQSPEECIMRAYEFCVKNNLIKVKKDLK